jgi:hypothetical protein
MFFGSEDLEASAQPSAFKADGASKVWPSKALW